MYRGRFQPVDAEPADALAAMKVGNPYYREAHAPEDKPIELGVVFGMLDFLLYVFAVLPLAHASSAYFFLWVSTIPFGFLSAAMPVGPLSALYWRSTRSSRVATQKAQDMVLLERQLVAR